MGIILSKEQIEALLQEGKIEELIDSGITELQIREALSVKKTDWNRWKQEIPELERVCGKASGLGYLEAQATLLKRAKGYFYTEEHQEIPIDIGTGKPIGSGKLIKEKKWCPPDPDSLNKLLSMQLLASIKEVD